MKATTKKSDTVRSGVQKNKRWKRLGWFVLIWLAGVATITIIGYGLRAFINSIYGI